MGLGSYRKWIRNYRLIKLGIIVLTVIMLIQKLILIIIQVLTLIIII